MSPFRVSIRPAAQVDAPFVAEMILLSLGSLADYLFEADEHTRRSFIEKLVRRNAGRFGLRFASVAEADGGSKGMLLACEGKLLDRLNWATLPHLFFALGVLPAFGFIRRGIALPGGREAEMDEYYISNIGVHPSAQGLGIGSALLDFAEKQARSANLAKCSLIVGLYNQKALRLYQRLGYEIVETVQHSNLGYHRMLKVL